MPRLLAMVSRKGKPCPLEISSSKVNCMFGLIEKIRGQYVATKSKNIPSTNEGRPKEKQRVKAVLRERSHPLSLMNNCESALTRNPADINFNGFVVLPHVQVVFERIGRVLKQQQINHK